MRQERKYHMTRYRQIKQHSKSMPNMLLMRPDTCGDRHWCDSQKRPAHPTGDGSNRARSGKSSGLLLHLLRIIVRSWPHVGAPRHVLEGASATAMDSVAQVYVVATAKPRWAQYGQYMTDIRKDTLQHLMHEKIGFIALQRDRFRRSTLPDDCGTLFKDQIIIIHSFSWHHIYIYSSTFKFTTQQNTIHSTVK